MNGPLLLLLCLLLSAAASYFLKLGAMASGPGNLVQLASHPWTLLGGLCYAATFAFYAIALQKVPLSLAQPVITGGASVVAALLSVLLLREALSPVNWLGLGLLCAGLYLLFAGRG
jgi:multidrug transporter EmrE-like cation transporter